MSGDFDRDGYVVIKNESIRKSIHIAKDLFIEIFYARFDKDPIKNRELIKRFADHAFISSIFTSETVVSLIKSHADIEIPVKCGPLVTHYTANDLTGAGYGLPYHQDYPSMASSTKSLICWLNLVDSGPRSHGVEVLPGRHKEGLLRGEQTDSGYVLDRVAVEKSFSVVPDVRAGDLLIMSSFLPHRTYVNADFSGWKLSLSQRFDDLSDSNWSVRGYKNAYRTSVDRELYKDWLSDDFGG